MTSSTSNLDASSSAPVITGTLLVMLAPTVVGEPEASLERTIYNLALALPGQPIFVAAPQGVTPPSSVFPAETMRHIQFTPSTSAGTGQFLTAASFAAAAGLTGEHNASACLLLGPEAHTIPVEALRSFGRALFENRADLVTPCYHLGPHDGLVNAAILYPVTRAIYGTYPRFPLGIDLGLSSRMVQRLGVAAHKFLAADQTDALVWPTVEAAIYNYKILEADVPSRSIPQPAATDLNALLSQILGSLFTNVEITASFWQRPRTAQSRTPFPAQVTTGPAPDPAPLIEDFQLAYANLHEIWAIVLPPASLLGLKRLSMLPANSFILPDTLWARIIYDFILAFRFRTINRGHLLGALTPIYLAWVASHLVFTAEQASTESHLEAVAAAFEAEKPYFVARWRWPDRFNP